MQPACSSWNPSVSGGASRLTAPNHGSPASGGSSGLLTAPNQVSDVRVQECSHPTSSFSCPYPYRPFSSRGLSLKSYNEGNYRSRSKKKKVAMWEKEFTCFAHINQKRTPDPLHKAELIRAGLGGAWLSLFENGDAWEFHEQLVEKFL